jgi:CheY-like chemotaxis protein
VLEAARPSLVKLLVVDDDPEIRRLIAVVLAPMAPDIAECADGADALAAYARHTPDVVLMDIAMPGLDGLAATAAIIATHPLARVVVVSNHGAADLREAARRAGACGYVLKEDLRQLRQVVEQASGRA